VKIKFSIITPTYNRLSSGYLEQCIRSIQNQKQGEFEHEHILVDDGSTDGTANFIKSEIEKDSRIKHIFQQNSGPAMAIRRGIEHVSGDYVIIMGDDDLLPEDSLYLRSKYIKQNPSIDWFYARAHWIDGSLNKITPRFESEFYEEFLYERMLVRNIVNGGTPTVRKEALDQINWPEWLNRSDDYFIWLELLRPERNLKVGFLDEFVYLYRWHKDMHTNSLLSDKRYQEKIKLDNRIRSLHPKGLVFLADEVRKRDQIIGEQGRLIGIIVKLPGWKPLKKMAKKLIKVGNSLRTKHQTR